jgi:peptidoglycan-N-acetylglucosamine deacetylase
MSGSIGGARETSTPISRGQMLALAYGVATVGAVGSLGLSALSVGIPAAVFLALMTDGVARPSSNLFYPTVSHGSRNHACIALTFDDGPDPEVTPRVLDALATHGVRATFFAIGHKLEAHPELARRIRAEGHELGNHSWHHSRWQNFFGPAAHTRELARGARAIRAVTGERASPLYRPPIGLKSPSLARAAHHARLTLVGWSLKSLDTQIADPERIAARVLRRIRPGDIVLLHDGHDRLGRHRPACARAVPLILRGLHEKGLACATVSDLLRRAGAPDQTRIAPTWAR